MPAKAGIQNYFITLDYRLCGNAVKGWLKAFYKTIIFRFGKIWFSLYYLYVIAIQRSLSNPAGT